MKSLLAETKVALPEKEAEKAFLAEREVNKALLAEKLADQIERATLTAKLAKARSDLADEATFAEQCVDRAEGAQKALFAGIKFREDELEETMATLTDKADRATMSAERAQRAMLAEREANKVEVAKIKTELAQTRAELADKAELAKLNGERAERAERALAEIEAIKAAELAESRVALAESNFRMTGLVPYAEAQWASRRPGHPIRIIP